MAKTAAVARLPAAADAGSADIPRGQLGAASCDAAPPISPRHGGMLTVLDLFSGIGGFSLGLERTCGFRTVAFCEIDPFCRRVLAKHWPGVPCYDDVRALTADRLRADGIAVDVICGGFPCQDVSIAGARRGLEGERSGLWEHLARIVGEVRPRFVVVENVAGLLSGPDETPGRWFGRVLGDLAALGLDAEWHCVSASAAGAAHVRDRVWLIAYPERPGWEGLVPHLCALERASTPFPVDSDATLDHWRSVAVRECSLRDGNGVSLKMERDRLRALGNAVVPQIPEAIGHAILAVEAASMRIAAE